MRSKADETLVIVETLICPLQISYLKSFSMLGFSHLNNCDYYITLITVLHDLEADIRDFLPARASKVEHVQLYSRANFHSRE